MFLLQIAGLASPHLIHRASFHINNAPQVSSLAFAYYSLIIDICELESG